ncbi:hypothetical protein ACJZ2D_013704 [Fusarium nematophilum]
MSVTTTAVNLDVLKQGSDVSAEPKKLSGLNLYSRFAFAGAVCCSVTHGGLTPVDVVKTRIQLDPATYNRGMIGGFRQVIQNEGASALLTGIGPTFAGYFLQGALKFGGYEFFKQQSINTIGYENARNNRIAVYCVSGAAAEFFADIALCPLEATRIRLVSEPGFANGLVSGFTKIARQEGLSAFYSGFGPILFKQVPYTMTKFVFYEKVGLPGESNTSRLIKIGRELGLRGSFSGIGARLFMVGAMSAGQFAIYGDLKKAMGATGGVEIAK